jgi:hypothetical protein
VEPIEPDIENMGIPHEISLLCSIEHEITRDKQNKKTLFGALGLGEKLLWGKLDP